LGLKEESKRAMWILKDLSLDLWNVMMAKLMIVLFKGTRSILLPCEVSDTRDCPSG
jgi:hypothetical protein